MEPNWAAEHLQVIRILMERSAIYRRALTPIMFLLGALGILASVLGWLLHIETNRAFGIFWVAVAVAAICGAYVMVRRQALRAREVFWSPPTRRVTQALLPPIFIAAILSSLLILSVPGGSREGWWLLPLWMTLYGTALHAAGFFMPRGIKLFGWVFILLGCAVAGVAAMSSELPTLRLAHPLMGLLFGGLHLAYGTYLSVSEKRKNEP